MEKIVYTKYSNERAPEFAIRTDIIEEHGVCWVRKRACGPEGEAHIENIYEASVHLEKLYDKTKIEINHCEKLEKGIKLEFLKGKTLQEVLDELLKKGKIQEFQSLLKEYLDLILQTGTEKFVLTEAFQKVFGNIEMREKFRSAPVTDIDMVLSNIFVHDKNRWTLIDYEWTFTFPIPVRFVIYRILHYYEYSNAFRNQISGWDLYQWADITEQEKKIFDQMERNFQKYVLGNYVPLRTLYPQISPGKTNLDAILKHVDENEKMQIFVSENHILKEEQSQYYPMPAGYAKASVEIEETVSLIRLDPGEKPGKVSIIKLEWESGEPCVFRTNGIRESEKEILFLEEDPQIYIENSTKSCRVLKVEFTKNLRIEDYAKQVIKDRKELKSVKQELENLKGQLEKKEQMIAAMENTKIWRIYKKYKMIIKGE